MAFQDMYNFIKGAVPKVSVPQAKIFINDAWREIRQKHLWSFQLSEGQWISPGQISAGTAQTNQGSNIVWLDPIAATACNSASTSYSLLTQRQFRIASGGIYNIYGFTNGTVNSVTMTYGGVYQYAPTVTFSPPPFSPTNVTATATPIMGTIGYGVDGYGAQYYGALYVIGLMITNPGVGYAAAPTITFSGGGAGSITAVATANYGGQLVLDRQYGEPSVVAGSFLPSDAGNFPAQSGSEIAPQFLNAYAIYQCYYPSPVKDFLRWVSVRDMQNFIDLYIDRTREELDATDPQRTWYYFPTWVVPYKPDPNMNSATYGYMLHELWGAPTYNLNYQLLYIRTGTDLMNPYDMLPQAVGEDCVRARAKYFAYEWAMANQGALERNQGPDYRFLMTAADKEFDRLLKMYRKQDMEVVDNWFSVRRTTLYGKFWAYFNSIGKTAYPGT